MISSLNPSADAVASRIIRSSDSPWQLGWADLKQHRELLYFLTWRDIKVRYKQTVLGVGWAILQPLAMALAITMFLGGVVHVSSEDLPYPIFAYSGMVVWQLFAQALTESSNSLVANERLITKVYFPRLLFPMSAVLASLLDFFICLVVLAFFLAYYRINPTPAMALLPIAVFLAVLVALGVGLLLAALNVRYRDVRYTVGFLVQLWFLATPIAYPTSVVPDRWRVWYSLNPMVGVLAGFRYALKGTGAPPWHLLAVSACLSTAIFLGGLYYFRRTEDFFADFI